jgi:ubiquitin carboxyl-terminal hydrolase 8
MSPTAHGGPPHSRASSVNARGPISAENGAKINGLDGAKGAGRVYPHLDDLVAVKPDVGINATIRKLLAEGESLAKQADTHLDFRRPEVALQELPWSSYLVMQIGQLCNKNKGIFTACTTLCSKEFLLSTKNSPT